MSPFSNVGSIRLSTEQKGEIGITHSFIYFENIFWNIDTIMLISEEIIVIKHQKSTRPWKAVHKFAERILWNHKN
jgi:hypothetical protein